MKHRESKDQILEDDFRCEDKNETCAGWLKKYNKIMSNVFHYFANNEPLESKQKRSSKLQTALTVSRFLMHRQFSRDTGGKGCDEDQALLANTISPKLKTQIRATR